MFVGRAFGDEDQLVPGVEQGKCVFDTRHQVYRMMKEFLLLLGDPRFQVGDAVGTGDFVERLAVGAAAVAGDLDVALLGFPKELRGHVEKRHARSLSLAINAAVTRSK